MLSYPLRTALSGLRREKWINLLSALTVATGLFLITLAVLFVHNVNIVTKRLPEKFSVTAFLDEGLPPDRAQDIVRSIRQRPDVKEARYISKEDAMKELKGSLRNAEYILEGLGGENPLPASVELRLVKGAVTWASVESLSMELKDIKGISEVQYGKKFLTAIQSVKSNSEAVGLALIVVISSGMLFVCYSTMKILFYRKKEEVETLKFLGASKGFIRAPFVIEGGIIGLSGGLLSAAGTFSLYYLIYHRLTEYMPVLRIINVPDELVIYAPLAGLLIGAAGAVIAVGRIRF